MEKTIIIFLTMLNLMTNKTVSAQTDKTNSSNRTIEVTGTAETLIVPNEFTFKIVLNERIENKEKITIEKQEEKLKEELVSIGIDVQKDLTIADLNSFYLNQKRKRDVFGSKEYALKMYDLSKIDKLQQMTDKLNIGRLDLIQATHSDLERFRKETKMEAVKAAKRKAEYMLEAVGEKIGRVLMIQESMDYGDYQGYLNRSQMGELAPNSSITIQDALKTGETLSFTKIKLKYNVVARFEIK